MLAGAGEVKIHGSYVPVQPRSRRRSRIFPLTPTTRRCSAWLGNFSSRSAPDFHHAWRTVAADALRHRIEEKLHWTCRVPEYLEACDLRKA
jgi:metallo-beta-lactamase family protein